MVNKILNTKEGAYLLGFLWGDGFVKEGTIKITINEFDAIEIRKNLIKIFENNFYEKYINIYDNPSNKNFKKAKNQIEFKILNKELFKFLINYNYHIKKTGISCDLIISKIKHKNYFFRGIIDADGNISDNKSGKCVQVTSCINQDWTYMINYCKLIGVNKFLLSKSINHGGKSKWSTFTIRRTDDILIFLKEIYNSNYDNIGLDRKYQKGKKIIDRYINIDTKNGIYLRWNENEILYLKNNYEIKKYIEISKDINRTIPSIKCMIKKLKLKKNRIYVGKWTDDEINFLLNNYPSKGCKFCATHLNKTKSSIYGAVNKYKLKKNFLDIKK